MEHSIERVSLLCGFCEEAFQKRPVGQVTFDNINVLRQKLASAVAEVVENYRLMAAFEEEAGDGASDVTSAARNENLHKKPFSGLSSYGLV
jgi:hypothetical protein